MKMKFKIKNEKEIDNLKAISEKYFSKSSRKRKFIIDYFLKCDKHFSVEELYTHIKKLIPGIGYSTVYRTLRLLVARGQAVARNFEKGLTRFEPIHQKNHHDHLVCIKCGKIIEFTNPVIERIQKKVALKYKFSVSDHKLEIYGLCQKCAKGMK
ncbi:MAG: Fur family transcriptional regulator [bacterium]